MAQNIPQIGDKAKLSYTNDPVTVSAVINPGLLQITFDAKPTLSKTFSFRKNGRWVDRQMDMYHGTYLMWN